MNSIRRDNIEKRKVLSGEVQREWNGKIREFFLSNFVDRKLYFIYLSYNNEVDTYNLIRNLLSLGKRVAIPKTYKESKKIEAVEIFGDDFTSKLIPGHCSIPEPSDEYCVDNRVAPSEIDIVVCPGSAFDESGVRMGYGGGFYDRFLSQKGAASITKVGLCYEFQLNSKLDKQDHDVNMDFVITNIRVVNC